MANLNFQHWKPTEKQERIAACRFACTVLMEEIALDEHFCHRVVAGDLDIGHGRPPKPDVTHEVTSKDAEDAKRTWRIFMTRNFRKLGLMVNDYLCDRIYQWACDKLMQRYHLQFSQLTPHEAAKVALDHTEQRTPLTPLEIVDDLVLDSSSSDDGRRFIYGRDGSAERTFEQLKDELKTQIKQGGLLPYREEPRSLVDG